MLFSRSCTPTWTGRTEWTADACSGVRPSASTGSASGKSSIPTLSLCASRIFRPATPLSMSASSFATCRATSSPTEWCSTSITLKAASFGAWISKRQPRHRLPEVGIDAISPASLADRFRARLRLSHLGCDLHHRQAGAPRCLHAAVPCRSIFDRGPRPCPGPAPPPPPQHQHAAGDSRGSHRRGLSVRRLYPADPRPELHQRIEGRLHHRLLYPTGA